MSSFPLPVCFFDGCVVVTLPDEIDITNAGMVSRALQAVLDEGVAVVIADLTRTTFSDAAAIRAITGACRRAAELGRQMRVVITHPVVRRAFALTGADTLVRCYGRIDQALAGTDRAAGADRAPARA
jgi:anti-anti-sigma factor